MATVYPRGRSWYLQWSEGGRQIHRSLGRVTRTDAERAKKLKEAELAGAGPLLSSAPPLDDYAGAYLQWYAYEYPASLDRTEYALNRHILPEFGTFPLDRIGPMELEQYKSRRMEKAKSGTVAKEVRIVKSMLARAVEWMILDRHPCPNVKAPQSNDSRPPRWYTREELEAIYKASPKRAPMFRLMANTGMRRTEALMARRSWVQGDTLFILSEEGARTKSGKWRSVSLTPGARKALEELPGEDYILPRMRPESLSNGFRYTVQAAKLDGTLHCLRHTFAAHLIQSGCSLRDVQVLMGHSSYRVTEQYAHLSPEHLKGVMAGLDL